MKNAHIIGGTAAWTIIAMTGAASAQVTITAGTTSGGTYGSAINFDEPGGPTGMVASNSWAGVGMADIIAFDGLHQVGDYDATALWGLGDGNSFFGNFGIGMYLVDSADGMSFQVWDPAGPSSFFGGGMSIRAYNDGVEVAAWFDEPAWGGIGNSWIHITGGEFDAIEMAGFGFPNTTYADNISWNAVPAPTSAAALLGFAGLASRRRRA